MSQKERAVLVLITRPQATGSALAARLRSAGHDALCWPAFDLLPPDDPAALAAQIARLAEFDLVVFVSPAAVQAFASTFRRLDPGTPPHLWPSATRIAAVGAATRTAVLESLPGAAQAQMICPAGAAAEGGSEMLVAALADLNERPRSVLLVRAQKGREHLSEWLRGHGAGVEEAIAYRRIAHVPEAAQWERLRAGLRAGARLAVLYSSSEAVSVLAGQFAYDPAREAAQVPAQVAAPVPAPAAVPAKELSEAFTHSIALCIHERIERAARACGFTDVRSCNMDVASIRAALREPVES